MGGRGGGGRGGRGSQGSGGGGGNPWGGGGGARRVGEQNNQRENREDVKKFLTYYKRTNSICIDLYGPAFYKRKPFYDELADFVYDILCPSDQLRSDLEDVQLHPVKKHLLIKFRTTLSRDAVLESLSGDGLDWPVFKTKVQGWAMDKPVLFVRVLGASPLTSREEIRDVMEKYGEIIEVKKGFLSKRLPNVTNGTWTVRMVLGVDKTIPSFVFVKDDGEIWQLAHDSQVTICWKCGGEGHIGTRCREKAVSLDGDLLRGNDAQQEAAAPAQTWAHVVRRRAGMQVGRDVVAHQAEAERERLAGIDRERLDGLERERLDGIERERLAVVERVRLVDVERERLTGVERDRLAVVEEERLVEDERERLAEVERNRLADIERERLVAVEKDRLAEVERNRQAEDERIRLAGGKNRQAEDERVSQIEIDPVTVEVTDPANELHLVAPEAGAATEYLEVADMLNKEDGVVAKHADKGAAAATTRLPENSESYVSIKDTSDSIFTCSKKARNDEGSPVPCSTEAVMGSSPDLHHKEPARGSQLLHPSSAVSQLSGGSHSLGDDMSDLGTSKGMLSSEEEEVLTPSAELATSNSLEGGINSSQ